MKKLNWIFSILISLFVLLTSCEKDTTGTGEQGRLTIKLTDDPFPIHFISDILAADWL